MSLSRKPRQYMGVRAILPPDLQTAKRDPTSSDRAYVKGTLWLNTASETAFMWSGVSWIPISSAGSSGLTWVNNAVTSTMLTNNGYIVTSGALILTLPTTSAVGDSLQIMLNGGTSFQIAQAAGQQIRFSASQTTSGVGGSITSTQQGNVLHLICTAANTQWQVDYSIGNMTVI